MTAKILLVNTVVNATVRDFVIVLMEKIVVDIIKGIIIILQ